MTPADDAVDLFFRHGYGFYRAQARLVADLALARDLACTGLKHARSRVAALEAEHRHTRIPLPTRAQPFASPDVIVEVQWFERLGQRLAVLEARLRAHPLPSEDALRRAASLRSSLLAELAACDEVLVGGAQRLRRIAEEGSSETMLAARSEIDNTLTGIEAAAAEHLRLTG